MLSRKMARTQRISRSVHRVACVGFAAGAVVIAGLQRQVSAGTLYWDSDANAANNTAPSTTQGGTGAWNTTLLNWYNGASDVVFASGSVASFGGTAGIVTIPNSTTMTTGGLEFTTTGYDIKGTNSASRVNVTNGNVSVGVTSATIDAVFDTGAAGNPVTKTGSGTLMLSPLLGNNVGSGTLNIYDGTIQLNSGGTTTSIILAANILNIGDGVTGGPTATLDSTNSNSTSALGANTTVNLFANGVWSRANLSNTIGGIGMLSGQTVGGGKLTFTVGGNSTATAFTTGNATISGSSTINADIGLGQGGARTRGWTFTSSSDTLEFNGAISSAQANNSSMNFAGPSGGGGTVTYGGTTANTYGGATTVAGTTLRLNKTASVDAIASTLGASGNIGSVNITGGGTIQLLADEQINNATGVTLTINASTFDLNGHTETIDRLPFYTSNATISTPSARGLYIVNSTTALQSANFNGADNVINANVQLNTLASRNGGPTNPARLLTTPLAADALSITGVISNSDSAANDTTRISQLAVQKTGLGTLTLTGANTYIGATQVGGGYVVTPTPTPTPTVTATTGGTFVLNNLTGSATGQGAVNVSQGILGGTGSASGVVTTGDGTLNPATATPSRDSTLSPGANPSVPSIATLSVGGLVFNADGTFDAQINSSTALSDTVKSASTGSVSLGAGIAALALSDLGSTKLVNTTIFTLIDNLSASATTGFFFGLPDNSIVTVGLNTYKLDYDGGTGNDVTLTYTAIPEPTGLALLTLGGIAALRRRRTLRSD